MDPKRRALLAEAEKNKAFVTDKPFKMASPMKRSVGPGDYYGTLGAKLPHEPVWENILQIRYIISILKDLPVSSMVTGIYSGAQKEGRDSREAKRHLHKPWEEGNIWV